MSYVEYKRKRKKQSLQSHTGKYSDYVKGVQSSAAAYGENLKTAQAREYAQKMYALAFDARMVLQAYKDQKGHAAGIDHIQVDALWREQAFMKWANHCRIPFNDRPLFQNTIFAKGSPTCIAMLSLLYNPDHMYRLKGISFSGAREALATLDRMGSLCTLETAEELCKQFQGDDPLSYEVYGDLSQNLHTISQDPNLILNAWKTLTALNEAVSVAGKAIDDAINLATAHRIKDKVLSFTPLSWKTDPKKAENHLLWEACQKIHDMMTTRGYRPKPLRQLEIPKSDGGVRTLNIPTVIDRTVERAAFMTIEPMLEKKFRPNSVGCRNDMDRFDALAAISNHFPHARGKYILCADIRKAFDNVHHEDLLSCLEKVIPNQDMMRYLRLAIKRPGTNRGDIGIHQGGPLSPMFLNVLLHEHLDLPFLRRLRSDLIYIRYVDDLAVFGFESEEEGQAHLELLQGTLRPIGLGLHTEPPKTQIVNLEQESLEAEWDSYQVATLEADVGVDRYLGLGLHGTSGGQLRFFLTESWQRRLIDMYQRADKRIAKDGYSGTNGADTHILHATKGWLDAFAPAWHESIADAIETSIRKVCAESSPHHNLVLNYPLAEYWKRAYRAWLKRTAETDETTMMGWVKVKGEAV